MIVIEDMVYQIDKKKIESIPASDTPITKTDLGIRSIDEKEKKDEAKKKQFEENISATNYLAMAGLFLFELVCNTTIFYIIVC